MFLLTKHGRIDKINHRLKSIKLIHVIRMPREPVSARITGIRITWPKRDMIGDFVRNDGYSICRTCELYGFKCN